MHNAVKPAGLNSIHRHEGNTGVIKIHSLNQTHFWNSNFRKKKKTNTTGYSKFFKMQAKTTNPKLLTEF